MALQGLQFRTDPAVAGSREATDSTDIATMCARLVPTRCRSPLREPSLSLTFVCSDRAPPSNVRSAAPSTAATSSRSQSANSTTAAAGTITTCRRQGRGSTTGRLSQRPPSPHRSPCDESPRPPARHQRVAGSGRGTLPTRHAPPRHGALRKHESPRHVSPRHAPPRHGAVSMRAMAGAAQARGAAVAVACTGAVVAALAARAPAGARVAATRGSAWRMASLARRRRTRATTRRPA